MNRWIEAARPRTLPLALANILLGNFLAFSKGNFSFITGILTILTTLFLQILSNFANDYGDSKKGTDNLDRKVAMRTVQTGKISLNEMKKGIYFLMAISFLTGIGLIYFSLKQASLNEILLFLLLGIFAILSSIGYTMGKKPYGYLGLGDLFVFLFFGLIGTMGSYYLQTLDFNYWILMPASSVGFLSIAVLNLNNLRDIENDKKNGKISMVVRMGFNKGIVYQKILILFGCLGFLIYNLFFNNLYSYLLLALGILPLLKLFFEINNKMKPEELDPYLKKTALSTLWMVIVFGISQFIQ
ncbi:MAG: 1,4-dihydroxy-2-naphthoate octaprenyltransferase [Bacteroidota bacterium]|jgi:1,4-dihydroxy-2-naphthoate octaprenyltransferase